MLVAHRNTIAFFAFVAVFGWLSFYIYGGQSSGVAHMFGQAAGVFVILLITAGVALARRKPVRADIVLGLGAGLLLFVNREDIAATYDVNRFQAEVRAAGPGNIAKAIDESTTDVAAALRSAMEATNHTDTEVQNLVEQLTDPVLEGFFLAPEKFTDRSALVAVNEMANRKLSLLSDTIPKVDVLLRQEQARLAEIAPPQSGRDGTFSGLSKTRGTEREYVVQHVDLYGRLMKNTVVISEFLLARAGSFSRDTDGALVFQTQADVDAYTRMFTERQKIAGEMIQLDAEIAAFNERRIAEGWPKMAGQQ